ncbi:hydroxyethylthiazole kinase-like uncharacterized protein yjeF [Rhodovulum iodosum]|uniref:Bifunctional NAD(P)H-hydrate repair enzyme n=1 Tax=Rhodovulum iodosum TaxID=68291 RepID=A0ABV3XVE4_9RHOB|nr:NAD(P)H-hydrate dehydratase [Rhodovulum robiginosum]RSK33516.1 NAD(P)H-hydrate dehydratase [Rhodovulum robiginosum]
MAELLTSAQMRAVEQAAIASGSSSGLTLMERAGRAVVDAVFTEWPDLAEGRHRAVVLCGPGNNGGDGFVIARRLAVRGWQVELFLLGDPDKLPPDARRMHDLWAAMGPVRGLAPESAGAGARPDLLVDALFGTGLSRPIPEAAVGAFRAVRERKAGGLRTSPCRVVAVDSPSGLDCDSGEMLLPALPQTAGRAGDVQSVAPAARMSPDVPLPISADLTVTFHKPKLGHYLGHPPMPSGKLAVADIGLADWDRPETLASQPPSAERVRLVGRIQHGAPMPGRMWPGPLLNVPGPGLHKYARGHALVLAGGPGRGGAARLAARAALRVGAGLVTVACPPEAQAENAARLDAIMLRPLADAEALAEMLTDRRLSAVCLGPGLGVGAATAALVAAACASAPRAPAPRAVVLDADALTSFADDPDALFADLHARCVLTPHEGEFARLFPDLAAPARRARGQSKVEACRAAAARAGCTVLLKGPDTVIASPGGAASIHAALYDRAAPWLGTAGAGDVLAGMIAGLLASPQAFASPHPHVEVAAWLHVEAARTFGPGLIAEDLPETLPRVFRDLGL